MVKLETGLAQDAYESAGSAFDTLVFELLVIQLLAIVVSLIITYFMSRMIVRPLKHSIAVAGRIAGGDISSEVRVEGSDEIGQLMQALKDMNESHAGIVSNVSGATGSIATTDQEHQRRRTDDRPSAPERN